MFCRITLLINNVFKPSGVGGAVGHAQTGTYNTGVLADREFAKSNAYSHHCAAPCQQAWVVCPPFFFQYTQGQNLFFKPPAVAVLFLKSLPIPPVFPLGNAPAGCTISARAGWL
jgi:hypothetical protein